MKLARTGEAEPPHCRISLTQRGQQTRLRCYWQAKPLTRSEVPVSQILGNAARQATEETAMHPTISYHPAMAGDAPAR
jgi:hypothetical protein